MQFSNLLAQQKKNSEEEFSEIWSTTSNADHILDLRMYSR